MGDRKGSTAALFAIMRMGDLMCHTQLNKAKRANRDTGKYQIWKVVLMDEKRIDSENIDEEEEFGDAIDDSILTLPVTKLYRMREAILMSKRLGRPLTEEEMAEFYVKDF